MVPDTAEMLDGIPHEVDPATFPTITIAPGVGDYESSITRVQDLLVTLAENLELENQALLRSDTTILTAVDHGDRLKEMQGRLRDAIASGKRVVRHYRFDGVHVVTLVPFGVQTGVSVGLESRGTVTEETYDGAGKLLDQRTSPFAVTFAVRKATGARWLNVAVLPGPDG